MFWKSIIEGFAILGHWQVITAAIIYAAAILCFMLITTTLIGKNGLETGTIVGFGVQIIGGIVLEGILMGLVVVFLIPILLGESSANSISTVFSLLWPAVKIGILASVAVTMLCLVPFFGGLIAQSNTIQVFLEGVIIFRLFSEHTIEQMLIETNAQSGVYPGVWACIGFIVIASITGWLTIALIALLSIPFEDTAIGELIPIVGAPVLGVLVGMIPLFMYTSYVRLSIMQLIGG